MLFKGMNTKKNQGGFCRHRAVLNRHTPGKNS